MQIKKIFLASSEELKDDRRAFELMLGRLNREWRQRDINFDILVWEDFIDSMSKEGLQKEYNKAIQECDIFVMLFFTKVGRYTLEEFETAFADLKGGTGPFLYTFFRNDIVMTGDLDDKVKTLLEFKARLRELKHYPTLYRNSEDLQWQFSRQLEKLYAGDGSTAGEITDTTPQWRIGEAALLLANRQLHGDSGAGAVDPARLNAALTRAAQPIRYAIFGMAQELRRQTWLLEKLRMERTIPIFEALIQILPRWHEPHGQLAFALKDQRVPNWKRSLEELDKAIALRGDKLHEGMFYSYVKSLCLIEMDPNFVKAEPSVEPAREKIVAALRVAVRDLQPNWDAAFADPDAADIRTWLDLNGSPRLK
jgi:hypothetical protein